MEPGYMPWRADIDGLYSTYKRYQYTYSKIEESDEYTNEADSDDKP